MFAFLSKINITTAIGLLLIAGMSFLSLRIGLLQNTIKEQSLQLEIKTAKLATAKQSIEIVSQTNINLNSTIDTLTQHLKDERRAVEFIKKYNATVDASVNKAVGKLKGLLKNEKDDCGSQPLPASVIDSMWQHYGTESSNPNS